MFSVVPGIPYQLVVPRRPQMGSSQEASWSGAQTASTGSFQSKRAALPRAPSICLSSLPYLQSRSQPLYRGNPFQPLAPRISFFQSSPKTHDQRRGLEKSTGVSKAFSSAPSSQWTSTLHALLLIHTDSPVSLKLHPTLTCKQTHSAHSCYIGTDRLIVTEPHILTVPLTRFPEEPSCRHSPNPQSRYRLDGQTPMTPLVALQG